MYKTIAIFVILCTILIITRSADEDSSCATKCAATSCRPLTPCNKPNEEIRTSPKDKCKCCPYCVTILCKGQKCDGLPFEGGFAAIVECNTKHNLICKDGICQDARTDS